MTEWTFLCGLLKSSALSFNSFSSSHGVLSWLYKKVLSGSFCRSEIWVKLEDQEAVHDWMVPLSWSLWPFRLKYPLKVSCVRMLTVTGALGSSAGLPVRDFIAIYGVGKWDLFGGATQGVDTLVLNLSFYSFWVP